jgi:3'-phosphoadenosine 5'-phosphosulfate sulfotransferase (PAPS reductase)/FAD synthetase
MINGRTRWQGIERAWIDQFENAPIGGGLAKCNPIAYWTLEDTFKYIAKYKIPHHPLHAEGYPSIGDAKDTIPIPEDKSVTFKNFEFQGDKTKWLDYAQERKGRFVGLENKDGSKKSECGIHVAGAERTFDRGPLGCRQRGEGARHAGGGGRFREGWPRRRHGVRAVVPVLPGHGTGVREIGEGAEHPRGQVPWR